MTEKLNMNSFYMICRRIIAAGSKIEFYKLALAIFLYGLKPNICIATENHRLKHVGN
jgi:hypothetical protein